ncbi:MAG: S26 family signal peptidase [archaeon]
MGNVIVYKVGDGEPIIHRVIDSNKNGIYTKGDNNMNMDQDNGIPAISNQSLQGRALFRIPLLGYVKIAFMSVTGG